VGVLRQRPRRPAPCRGYPFRDSRVPALPPPLGHPRGGAGHRRLRLAHLRAEPGGDRARRRLALG
jgi:hypothetical protein